MLCPQPQVLSAGRCPACDWRLLPCGAYTLATRFDSARFDAQQIDVETQAIHHTLQVVVDRFLDTMSRITNATVQREAISALQAARTTSSVGASGSDAARDSDTISIQSRHTLRVFSAEDEDEEQDPWSAIPRRVSSTPAAELPTLSRAQRKQLIVRALLQLLVLFVVCLVGLGGTLWLALPVISPEDKPLFKIPRSFDDLRALNTVLQHYKSEHFARVLLCWTIVYLFLQAFSIPGSMYMSILAGALFGVPLALPLVCASVATGASICYLISKFLGTMLLALPSWQARIDDWKHKLAQHDDNLLSYLIVLRMMPLPPHNIVNILSPHLGIRLGVFWLSTFGGIFAVSVIHVTIGEKLDQMTGDERFSMLSWRNVLLLGGVMVAVMLPVAVRRYNRDPTLTHAEHGAVYLDEQVDDDAPHLPESFRRNLAALAASGAADDDDDDELPPHRSVDTHHLAADDSFPNWTDARSSCDDSDEHMWETHSAEYARGGVFADRHARDATPNAHAQSSTRARLKSWIHTRTGVKL